jgi:hypothetical protein
MFDVIGAFSKAECGHQRAGNAISLVCKPQPAGARRHRPAVSGPFTMPRTTTNSAGCRPAAGKAAQASADKEARRLAAARRPLHQCRSHRSAVLTAGQLRFAPSRNQFRSTRRCTRLFQRVRAGEASIVESELAIRVKFENGAVSTEKNFAPAAWLARQTSASVIASPWQ